MCGDREVTIHTGKNFFGVGDDILGTNNDRGSILDIHTSGEPSTSTSPGADGQVTTRASGHDSDGMISFTPVLLVGDNLVSWLAAARQHSL